VTTSMVRDLNLKARGKKKIDWVSNHLPVLNLIGSDKRYTRALEGKRIGIALHLEAKTAYLAMILQRAGAEVSIAGSNPLSTQDDVAAALASEGVKVYAWYGATPEEYHSFLNKIVDDKPQLILDDGGDLVSLLHQERREALGDILGGSEETTTGVIRLRAMEADGVLEFPMLAVNDAYSKYLFDNRYGTGQSTWDAIMRNTNLVVSGKTAVIVGYGWCGKGVAMRAKGLGADVIVTEVDPIRANEALMDGFRVMPLVDAARQGDFFVTVTGNKYAIRKEHFLAMKDKAILANAGHFDVEIAKPDLDSLSVEQKEVRPNITEYTLTDGRRIYLLAEGRLVNLAAGDGHPAEIMDLSFASQVLALNHVAQHYQELGKRVVNLPVELDRMVLAMRLEALGIKIDSLTEDQVRYLKSWQV